MTGNRMFLTRRRIFPHGVGFMLSPLFGMVPAACGGRHHGAPAAPQVFFGPTNKGNGSNRSILLKEVYNIL